MKRKLPRLVIELVYRKPYWVLVVQGYREIEVERWYCWRYKTKAWENGVYVCDIFSRRTGVPIQLIARTKAGKFQRDRTFGDDPRKSKG